jgi:hypothetical protein
VLGVVTWLTVRRWNVRGVARGIGSGLVACLAVGLRWTIVLLRYSSLSQIVRSIASSSFSPAV